MLGGFPSLLFSEAWSGSNGGGLAIGGVRVGFVSGLDGFAVFWTRVAGVGRLGEDEGELERTAYCTCVRRGVTHQAAQVVEERLRSLRFAEPSVMPAAGKLLRCHCR